MYMYMVMDMEFAEKAIHTKASHLLKQASIRGQVSNIRKQIEVKCSIKETIVLILIHSCENSSALLNNLFESDNF